MIELTYADVHQHAVMVILMHTSVTLIAMTHPYPLLYATLHALLRMLRWRRQNAVIGIATRVVSEDKVVKKESDGEFPRVEAMGEYEGDEKNEVCHEDCIFGIYHIDYIWTII